MENSPLISVVVPVYKAEKYLDSCLESIVSQTHENLEIILVDDGSPDGSGAMCDAWEKRDARIRVIHKENGGAASARNAGINLATGEYIGFVDSDDMIHRETYRCMLQALSESGGKVAACKLQVVWDDTLPRWNAPLEPYKTQVLNATQTVDEICAFRMGTSFCRRLFHASVFEELRFPEGDINEEYPLLIPIAVKGEGTVSLDQVFYYYRKHSDSVTGTVHASMRTMRIVATNLELMKQQLQEYELGQVKNFPFFVAQNALFMLLSILKNHKVIEGELKELYARYLAMAKANKGAFFKTKESSFKNKILYLLIITGVYPLLRRTKIK